MILTAQCRAVLLFFIDLKVFVRRKFDRTPPHLYTTDVVRAIGVYEVGDGGALPTSLLIVNQVLSLLHIALHLVNIRLIGTAFARNNDLGIQNLVVGFNTFTDNIQLFIE